MHIFIALINTCFVNPPDLHHARLIALGF